MSKSHPICALMLLTALAGQAPGASSDWAAVQSVPPGQSVQVRLINGKKLLGTVDGATAETMTLQTQRQAIAVSRKEIRRLYVERKKKWRNPFLIGAGIGAAGAAIAGAKTAEHESGYGGAVAGVTAIGALIGGGIGYLANGTGTGKFLVYEAPAQER